ncbi:MAG: nucleoside diphosphate kinase regulator [Candidatus Anammoximicrobium sp.]|nr:nucleoside diphosphate kinase regulator [Candidatus Anammoximicrobium sp.]
MSSVNEHNILVSSVDYGRLDMLLRDEVASGITPRDRILALRVRLQQAQVMEPSELPDDVITMNSTIRLRDLDSDELEVYSLMYPAFANGFKNCISVLAPLGTAILGHRAGDLIDWTMPSGCLRLKVEDVAYQPERVGEDLT